MTKSVTIHATPGTRTQWSTNQCVMVSTKLTDCLVVTSGQNRSTPGLYTRLYLKQNTHYTIEVKGCVYNHTKAFVWIYDPQTRQRLIPNYTLLPRTRGCVSAHFCTPASANDYICIYAGVLFTGPPTKGNQFELCELTVGCGSLPNTIGHAKEEHCSPQLCSEDKDSVCSTESDSEFEVHHHHHRHPGSTPHPGHYAQHHPPLHTNRHIHHHPSQQHDPYYSYDTHKTRPYHSHTTSPHPSHTHEHSPSYTSKCPKASPPIAPDNCSIDDLQTSLQSMICRMKKN